MTIEKLYEYLDGYSFVNAGEVSMAVQEYLMEEKGILNLSLQEILECTEIANKYICDKGLKFEKDLVLIFDKYQSNDRPYIGVVDMNEGGELYADLTVNVWDVKLDDDEIILDKNNWPGVIDFCKERNIGEVIRYTDMGWPILKITNEDVLKAIK